MLISEKSGAVRTLSIFAWAIALGCSAAFANVREVDCDKGQTIANVLKVAQPGDTIGLAGTCSENLLLSSPTGQFNGITLDGHGTATISGPDPTLNVVELDGVSNFTFRGMR